MLWSQMFAAHRAFLHDVNEMDGSKESRVGRPRTRTCDVSHGCTTVDPESVGFVVVYCCILFCWRSYSVL